MADYSQLMNLEKKQKKQTSPSATQQEVSRPVDQPTDQLTNQSASQPTNQPTRRPVPSAEDTKTVERPKSFYITLRLDKRLDEAVRYFQEAHGIKKADRSILINAMLDTDEKWTPEALDLLVEKIVRLLTDKLMK